MGALVAVATTALAQSYVDYYSDGERAAAARNWPRVIEFMEKAIALDANSSASKRLRGTIREPYLPHHYLGIALAYSGRCAEASVQFQNPSYRTALAGVPQKFRVAEQDALSSCMPTTVLDQRIGGNQKPEVQDPASPMPSQSAAAEQRAAQLLASIEERLNNLDARLKSQLLAQHPGHADWLEEVRGQRVRLQSLNGQKPVLPSSMDALEQAAGSMTSELVRIDAEVSAAMQALQELATLKLNVEKEVEAAKSLQTKLAGKAGLSSTSNVVGEASRVAAQAAAARPLDGRRLQQSFITLQRVLRAANQEIQLLEKRESDLGRLKAELGVLIDSLQLAAKKSLLRRDESIRSRTVVMLKDALGAMETRDPDRMAVIVQRLRTTQQELDRATAKYVAVTEAWKMLDPLFLAYRRGDIESAQKFTIQTAWPPEVKVHALLVRAACIHRQEGLRDAVARDLVEASKISKEIEVPPRVFSPDFLKYMELHGLKLSFPPNDGI